MLFRSTQALGRTESDQMIQITKVPGGYVAHVSPPQGDGSVWEAKEPFSRHELVERLPALGCHQTVIGDAFYKADPFCLAQNKPLTLMPVRHNSSAQKRTRLHSRH